LRGTVSPGTRVRGKAVQKMVGAAAECLSVARMSAALIAIRRFDSQSPFDFDDYAPRFTKVMRGYFLPTCFEATFQRVARRAQASGTRTMYLDGVAIHVSTSGHLP